MKCYLNLREHLMAQKTLCWVAAGVLTLFGAGGLAASETGPEKEHESGGEASHAAAEHEPGSPQDVAHGEEEAHPAGGAHGEVSHAASTHGASAHGEEAHGEEAHGGGGHGGGEHHNGFTMEMGFANQRLWRGFVENGTPALQPKLGFHYNGLAVYSFSNIAHTGPHGQNWTEHELEVEYEKSFGKFTAVGGYIHYAYPDITSAAAASSDVSQVSDHAAFPASYVKSPVGRYLVVADPHGGATAPVHHATPRYTQEVFVGLSHRSWLNPSFRVYRDFDQRDGTYYYLSMGHPFAIRRNVIVRPTLGLGVNQHLIIANTAVSNLDLGVAVDFHVSRHLILSPFFMRMIGHRTLFGSHNLFGVRLLAQ